jgi:hypothetical protein
LSFIPSYSSLFIFSSLFVSFGLFFLPLSSLLSAFFPFHFFPLSCLSH